LASVYDITIHLTIVITMSRNRIISIISVYTNFHARFPRVSTSFATSLSEPLFSLLNSCCPHSYTTIENLISNNFIQRHIIAMPRFSQGQLNVPLSFLYWVSQPTEHRYLSGENSFILVIIVCAQFISIKYFIVK